MLNLELSQAVESFALVISPLSDQDLERTWIWKDHDEEGVRFSYFVTIQELRDLAVQLSSQLGPLTPAQLILGQYHAQYLDLQAAILGIPEEEAERAPAEGEWPVRRVYSHILGAEIGFSAVVRFALEKHRTGTWSPWRMTDQDEERMMGMSGQKYGELTQGPFKQLVAFHHEFHPKIMQEFCSITEKELGLPSAFWEESRFPIRHRLHRFEAHIIQHTVQIDKTLLAIGSAPSETKRLTRYLFASLAGVNAQLIGRHEASTRCGELAATIESRTREIQEILA